MKKKCLNCNREFEKSTPRANNVKFCSVLCRDQMYAATGKRADAQRRHNDKKHSKPFGDARQCIVCGLWYNAVCHHAWQKHELSEAEYKRMAGLDHKKGLIPEGLKFIKAEQVFENGTVANLTRGRKQQFVRGDPRAGRYERSPETLERLKKQFKHT